MQELMLRPTIYRFQTCQEFVDQYHISEGDLILTMNLSMSHFSHP